MEREKTQETSEAREDLRVERFVFKVKEEDLCTYEFLPTLTVGVGDRTIVVDSCFVAEDLELNRYQLEGYAFNRETTLTFSASQLELEIKLRRDGDNFHWKGGVYCFVEIKQTYSRKETLVTGYCNEEETLMTLYESLLRATLNQPYEMPEVESWEYYLGFDRMTSYNQLKCPILERFFFDDSFLDRSYCMRRQVLVKRVFTLTLDYGSYLTDEQGYFVDYDVLEEQLGIPDFESKCWMASPDLSKWEEVLDKPEDWEKALEKGRELAALLRDALPNDYELWVEWPVAKDGSVVREKRLYYDKEFILPADQ